MTDSVESRLSRPGPSWSVGAIRQPPSLDDLAAELQGSPYRQIASSDEVLVSYGRRVGRQLIRGGRLLNPDPQRPHVPVEADSSTSSTA